MDPVTIIGVVSGILSFVGAAEKVLRLAWEIHNSVEGSSEDTEMRLKLAESVSEISKQTISISQTAPIERDRDLITLAQECNKLGIDIKQNLQDIKPKRRGSKIQSGLAALKTLLADSKIKNLENKLQCYRDQLHFHIAVLLR